MDFDLQKELHEMRQERRDDHAELVRKVDTGFAEGAEWMKVHEAADVERFNQIDKRLMPLETVKAAAVWLVGAVLVALLGAGGMIYAEHVNHLDKPVMHSK